MLTEWVNKCTGDVSSELTEAGNSISSLEDGNKPLEIINIDELKQNLCNRMRYFICNGCNGACSRLR